MQAGTKNDLVRSGTLCAVILVGLLTAAAAFAQPVTKPHTFQGGDVISAQEMNSNFDELYAKVNELDAQVTALTSGFGYVPVGAIVAWHKSLSGVPALPGGWMECNGQLVSDSESPLDGQTLPDLNSEVYGGGRGLYLRGGTTSGETNDSSYYSGNSVQYSGNSGGYYGAVYGQWNNTENGDKLSYSASNNTLGYPYVQVAAMTMVYIMRVK